MTQENKKHLSIFLITALSLTFLYLISDILLPFVVAIIIAYFFNPVTNYLEKFLKCRIAAAILILVFFALIITAVMVILIPILYDQFIILAQSIPEIWTALQMKLKPYLEKIMELTTNGKYGEEVQGTVKEISEILIKSTSNIATNILKSSVAIINLFALIFISPIVTFFMLRDWDKIIAKLDDLTPKKYKKDVRAQAKQIDLTLAGYIRGQTNICLLLAIFYSAALTIAGLDSGILIGVTTGILCFIPYLGVLFGMVIGTLVAFFQFGDLYHVLIIFAIFVFGQFVEGNFITPKIIGDKTGLHPVWIIFALLVGGTLFGFLGILFAIPAAAILAVLIRFYINGRV